MRTQAFWQPGYRIHITTLIEDGRKQIEELNLKMHNSKSAEEKNGLKAEIEKIKLEVRTALEDTEGNLY